MYLVPRIAGSGQPGPFPTGGALCAVIHNNGFGQENGSNCFAPILPLRHWLSGEWTEGKNELQSSLVADGIEQNTVDSFVNSYDMSTGEWLDAIGEREDTVRTALNIYFDSWKEDRFPAKEAEPQNWSQNVSKAVKQMLRVYALLKLGASALPGGSINVDLRGAHHASTNEEFKVTFMWGGREHFPRPMISAYLAAKQSYGVQDLLSPMCLLVLVDPAATPEKSKLLADVLNTQTPRIVDGNPPPNAPAHLQPPGDVVLAEKAEVSIKLLYDNDLLKEIDLPNNSTNLEDRLAAAISRELS